MAFAHPPIWGRIAGYRIGEEQSAGVPAISGRHGGAQLPGQDVAREVIEHGGQIEPPPAEGLWLVEVGLAQLVWGGRRMGEATGRVDSDEGRARDRAMVLQEPINGGL